MGADRSLPEEPQERGEVGQGRALQVEGRRGGHGQEIRRGERKEWGTPTYAPTEPQFKPPAPTLTIKQQFKTTS